MSENKIIPFPSSSAERPQRIAKQRAAKDRPSRKSGNPDASSQIYSKASQRKRVETLFQEARLWLTREGLHTWQIEHILQESANVSAPCRSTGAVDAIALSIWNTQELISLTRPVRDPKDETCHHFYTQWFVRWLCLALPEEEQLQDNLRQQLLVWVRS